MSSIAKFGLLFSVHLEGQALSKPAELQRKRSEAGASRGPSLCHCRANEGADPGEKASEANEPRTAKSATRLIRLKGHPRQSQTFDRKADAIRWAKQHETAVQTGRYLLSP